MKNEIVKQQASISVFDQIMHIAPAMHRSRFFGVTSPDQAAAIMLKGHELGLGFAQSFEFVHVIQGKPTLSPRGALALALASGLVDEMEIIEERDAKGKPFSCTVKGKRGALSYSTSFTMDDARTAGLVKKDGAWETYPANMLKWRAIGFWLDVLFPDTQGGMKRADEFGAWVDDKGDIIDAVTVDEPESSVTVDDLMLEYGADEVMEAIVTFNGGAEMPTTAEDVEAVKAILDANKPTYTVLTE